MYCLTKIKENWMKLMRNLQAGDMTNCSVAIAFDVFRIRGTRQE
jgi:hypothetical protein